MNSLGKKTVLMIMTLVRKSDFQLPDTGPATSPKTIIMDDDRVKKVKGLRSTNW